MSRRRKRALQVCADVFLLWAALWLAFMIRLGFDRMIDPFDEYLWLFIAAPAAAIPLFVRFGLYRAVLRYFGSGALVAMFNAVSLSALLLAVIIYLMQPDALMPRSVIFIYWALSLLFVGGLRLLMRQYFSGELFPVRGVRRQMPLTRVGIYGAGSAGNQLLATLRMGKSMQPVAFIDDDEGIAGRVIGGLKVYKSRHIEQMISDTGVEEVLLAIPSVSRSRRREILDELEAYPVHVRTIPGFMDLASGRVSVSDLQEVDIIDLLGRDAVPPRPELFERCIRDQVVMVTGAGGSIGSELCRQILTSGPLTLVLFEHSEYNLYSIQSELEGWIHRNGLPVRLVAILGSIRDADRLLEVMRTWQVQTVYHAAAYKHVPIVEHNIAEGVLNNVRGTLQTAVAAVCAGVENFVLISTDKAVRPTNVMGSTKRLAEMVLQAFSREPQLFTTSSEAAVENRTRFTMVRFGNVLGSSGSVIPLFREQIRRGGPVTVTHPNITRYFMTIPEAAQLVIQAGAMGEGGDVFVLDMGEPVKIAVLAEKMIHLSGLSVRSDKTPHGDITIEFTGLRPGEKLYEELLIGDNVSPTEHPMIMRANEEHLSWDVLKLRLNELLGAVERDDYECVRQLLRETVSGYKPEGEIVDWMHMKRPLQP
ncbi:nucleoside-diphosphate sugar epimerase/dehydratase [Pseudomonas sp. 8BK]|uniref:polysaccharide biosynthesis protein n=1 Tax=Pseudomonas sp. 8BK TaxID=2653164 RepID=UPI00211498DD|nr:nucleoside-diphosphate sugar epimerase/dehydratase [Pseudomonas sp. 8BK]